MLLRGIRKITNPKHQFINHLVTGFLCRDSESAIWWLLRFLLLYKFNRRQSGTFVIRYRTHIYTIWYIYIICTYTSCLSIHWYVPRTSRNSKNHEDHILMIVVIPIIYNLHLSLGRNNMWNPRWCNSAFFKPWYGGPVDGSEIPRPTTWDL